VIFPSPHERLCRAISILLGGAVLGYASEAAAQDQTVATVETHGATESAAGSQSEEIAEEAAKGSNRPEEKPASTSPLLWKGLIQGGLISRSDPRAEPANEFRLREAQVSVEGSPINGTHFFIEVNFPGPGEEVELNDAAVTFDVMRGVRVVAGQLRVPLNRPAVSARTSLFVTEPRAAGPVQRKARDRGINVVLSPFNGRVLYEQALVIGNGIQNGELGNDNDGFLLEGRLVWFATGEWPLPLPSQTDLQNSPWSTFFKAGWASGRFEKGLSEASRSQVREITWNVGQAVVGKGFYAYWQYSKAFAESEQNFDSQSFSFTSGYAFPIGRYLAASESAPRAIRDGWVEPKLQFEMLRYEDAVLSSQSARKIYRYGVNYYPLGTLNIRLMVDHEVAVRPRRSETLLVSLHYMF